MLTAVWVYALYPWLGYFVSHALRLRPTDNGNSCLSLDFRMIEVVNLEILDQIRSAPLLSHTDCNHAVLCGDSLQALMQALCSIYATVQAS